MLPKILSDLRRLAGAFWQFNRRAILTLVALDACLTLGVWRAAWQLGYPWPEGILPKSGLPPLLLPSMIAAAVAAAYLAISLSDRSPEAWQARLPAGPRARALFPHLLIWGHGFALYAVCSGPLNSAYELTGLPLAIGLGLVPALAFVVGRGRRRAVETLALVIGVEVGLNVLAWKAVAGLPTTSIEYVALDPWMLNGCVLGLAIAVAAVLDSQRARLRAWGVVGLLLGLTSALGAAGTRWRSENHESVRKLRALNLELAPYQASCAEFARAETAFNDLHSAEDEDGSTPYKNAADWREAVKILERHPDPLPATSALTQALLDPMPEGSAVRAWALEYFEVGHCSPISTYRLVGRLLRSLVVTVGLSAIERRRARDVAWKATVTWREGPGSLISTLVGAALLEQWTDREPLPADLAQRIRSVRKQAEMIKDGVRKLNADRTWPRSPSDSRLRAGMHGILETEILPVMEIGRKLEEMRAAMEAHVRRG